MRHFTDRKGNPWDAQVGRESYGLHVVLFMAPGSGEVRQTMLAADTWLGAEDELAALTEDELRERLEAARPWGDPGGPGF